MAPAGLRPGPLAVLPDASLAALAGSGNDGAFEALYARYRAQLLAYCARITGAREDAEEALQTAMLRAFLALSRGTRPPAVGAWLYGIARNASRDLVRARRSEAPLPESAVVGEGPHEQVERRQELRELREDLDALTRPQRTALLLRAVGDMPHEEVAATLGATPAEARALVHDARVSLAEFASGRELACDSVREVISAGDGRVLRGRRIRAHLRACSECRGHATATRRRGVLALPLPAFGLVADAARALWAGLRGLLPGGQTPSGGLAVGNVAAVVGTVIVLGVALPVAPAPSVEPLPSADPTSSLAPAPARGAPAAAAAASTDPAGPSGSGSSAAAPPPAGAAAALRVPRLQTPAEPEPARGTSPRPRSAASSSTPAGAAPAASSATASAGLPSLNLGVALPAVQLPRIEVPEVQLPPVKLPTVTAPTVTVPSVKLPKPLPTVSPPPVRVPSTEPPTVQLPPVKLPPVDVTVEVPPIEVDLTPDPSP